MKQYLFKNKIKRRIRYFEVDQLGIVYNSHYLEWFERGRVELLRELGTPYDKIEKNGFYLPVKEINVSFIKPLYFDQIITIETFLTKIKHFSAIFEYNVYNKDNIICATGKTIHVCVNKKFKIKKLPQYLIDKFR